MCTLCCREYTWQWIKIWIAIGFSVFDVIVKIAYYGELTMMEKQSPAGTMWIIIWVLALLIRIAYVSTRIVCVKRILRRPDDFDHAVPTEKNLRLETTVLAFDVVILLVENVPQFILLFLLQANGWTNTAIVAMISIFISVTIILFSAIYILCCCGSRSTLLRMRWCVVCCDFCGCGWSEKYDAARMRLESSKASGTVAIERMEAAGIPIPQGVREVIDHINKDNGDVTLDSPKSPGVQVTVQAQSSPSGGGSSTTVYTVQPQATNVTYATPYSPQPGQVVYAQPGQVVYGQPNLSQPQPGQVVYGQPNPAQPQPSNPYY